MNWFNDMYAAKKRFFIAAYWNPITLKRQYLELSAAGFDTVFVDEFSRTKDGDLIKAREKFTILKLCGELGLNVILQHGDKYTEQRLDLSQYPQVLGYAYDEPFGKHFENLEKQLLAFQRDWPDKTFFINLLTINADFAWGFSTYDEYFEGYVRCAFSKIQGERILSYDLYPLKYTKDQEKTPYLAPLWLRSLEVMGEKARAFPDTKFYSFIQSCSFNHEFRLPNEAEIRFQVYTNLAYGVQGIQYFTYRMPGDGKNVANNEFYPDETAMVGYDNKRTDCYYGVKKVNREIRAAENLLCALTFGGASVFWGKKPSDRENGNLKNAKNVGILPEFAESIHCGCETVLGWFTDPQGRKVFILVNFADPAMKIRDRVTLRFKEKYEMLELKRGRPMPARESGVYRCQLGFGEGRIVVLK